MINEEISKAEVEAFKAGKVDLTVGYLSSDGLRITTWTGDTLAVVTSTGKPYRANLGSTCTPFRAKGIDGRMYYGRHNGTGMHLKLRVTK